MAIDKGARDGGLLRQFYAALPQGAEPLLTQFAPSVMRDRRSACQPFDDGLHDLTDDGLDEEVHYSYGS
nr:hypothetical protein [uncultured Brevundimonas sp.]